MGFLNAPAPPGQKQWREDPFGRAFTLVITAIFGVLLGIQYWSPNKRVIPVVVAVLMFGVAWRLSMVAAINVLVFLLPYPKGTVFGSTNLAFIMIVFVIWLLRLSLRMSPPPRSSPLNLPILGLLLDPELSTSAEEEWIVESLFAQVAEEILVGASTA